MAGGAVNSRKSILEQRYHKFNAQRSKTNYIPSTSWPTVREILAAYSMHPEREREREREGARAGKGKARARVRKREGEG